MPKHEDVTLTKWLDLSEQLTALSPMSIYIDHSGDLYVLAETPSRDRHGVPCPFGDNGVRRIRTDEPQDVAVRLFDGRQLMRFYMPEQDWRYHFVQPLPDGEILLVCRRSDRRAIDDYDLNGRVFAEDGTLRREFLLGDGIADVQTTSDGRIWASYFDEGVFGNSGWDWSDDGSTWVTPVGHSGLVLWSPFGERLYEYRPSAGLNKMWDCYALNVPSDDETWCCYCDGFPLVCIREQQIQGFWQCPFRGSHGFALWQTHVLFQGGYDDHDSYYLFELMDDGQMKPLCSYRMLDEKGRMLRADMIAARGYLLFLLKGTRCYRIDMRDLLP